jgi:catechol 2,3-dioxygenase-like lactoylglutathione lyase family enzyme
MDHATPNLPSRNFATTFRFYSNLGFTESWRSDAWMILERGSIALEFFPYPDLDPASSSFGCCLRLDDVTAFFEEILRSGVPETTVGWPRAHRPRREQWGGLVGALIDPDGTLLRLVQEQG